MASKKEKNIVVIGGGTGTYTVLSALRGCGVSLSAVVSMCDDGGSTGRLRDEYGVLPPGDIRRSLIALSSADMKLRDLFEYRFENGGLEGHNFGNIFLTALEKTSGSFYEAVKTASDVLNVEGSVYPVTLNNVRLKAELENGEVITGETNIDIPKHNPELKISNILIEPKAQANPDALLEIAEADFIIIGPGDLYTSLLPNFAVEGVADAVRSSSAKKIYISNITTKHGETGGYVLQDFISEVEKYTGMSPIDWVLANDTEPHVDRLKTYSEEKAEFVSFPEDIKYEGKIKRGDLLTDTGLLRHDTEKLRNALMDIIDKEGIWKKLF